MSDERIAAVLAEHSRKGETWGPRGLALVCRACGALPLSDDWEDAILGLAAHQAAMLEPVIREVRAEL